MAQSHVKFFDGADEEEVRLVKELLCERGYFVRTDGTILDNQTGHPCYLPRSIAREIEPLDGVEGVV